MEGGGGRVWELIQFQWENVASNVGNDSSSICPVARSTGCTVCWKSQQQPPPCAPTAQQEYTCSS